MAPAAASRRGPGTQILLAERYVRKHHFLGGDDHILEWMQGKMLAWRIGGANQVIPGYYNTENVSALTDLPAVEAAIRASGDMCFLEDWTTTAEPAWYRPRVRR